MRQSGGCFDILLNPPTRRRNVTAPGLAASVKDSHRLAVDPVVLELMLGLGADKGVHGV
jgi:hypothetical protein